MEEGLTAWRKKSEKIRKDQQRSAKTRKDQHNMSTMSLWSCKVKTFGVPVGVRCSGLSCSSIMIYPPLSCSDLIFPSHFWEAIGQHSLHATCFLHWLSWPLVASRGLGPFLGDGQGPGFCGLRDPVSSEQGCALLQSVGPMDSKRVGSAYLYFSPRLDQTNLPGRFFGSLGANEDVPHGPLVGIDALMPELCQSRFHRVLANWCNLNC